MRKQCFVKIGSCSEKLMFGYAGHTHGRRGHSPRQNLTKFPYEAKGIEFREFKGEFSQAYRLHTG